MHTFNVYKRKTHRYVDSCRDMDEHQFLGTVRVTPPKQTREAEGYDDGGAYVQYARLPAGLSAKQRKAFRDALGENMSKWGCTHEYDCCGCELRRASASPTRDPRTVLIHTDVGYNY